MNTAPLTDVERALVESILADHLHTPYPHCRARHDFDATPPGVAHLGMPLYCALPANHTGPHLGANGLPVLAPLIEDSAHPGTCATCHTRWPCPTIARLQRMLRDVDNAPQFC